MVMDIPVFLETVRIVLVYAYQKFLSSRIEGECLRALPAPQKHDIYYTADVFCSKKISDILFRDACLIC